MKHTTITTLLAASASLFLCHCKGTSGGGITLAIENPRELIEGTEKPMHIPNLVQVPEKAPEFLVPEGASLLSKGKPVTSSDDAPIIGDLEFITVGGWNSAGGR